MLQHVFRSVTSSAPSFLPSRLIEDVGQVALPTVLTIVHGGHEDSGTTLRRGALPTQTLDFAVSVHLIEFENGQLRLLALVLDLLGSAIHLLLALLATTAKA